MRGVAKTRRLMKRMPDEVQQEIVGALDGWGGELATEMRGRTPRRTGAVLSMIKHKVFPRTLKMQVGLLGTKKARQRVFYARIVDLGRKAKTVRVYRRKRSQRIDGYQERRNQMSAGRPYYLMRVPAMAARRFVTGPLNDLRAGLNKHLKNIWSRALKSAAGGDE